jgi:tetratricopeptide (TPR) repeat protein
MSNKPKDLYEREIERYRDTLQLDTEVAIERYGMTLIHSLGPAEKVLALKEMGNDITDPADYYNLGHMHAIDENWDEAINFFRRAIELEPTMTDAIYNLAFSYEKAGLLPQAKSTWQSYEDALEDEDEKEQVREHLVEIDQ